MGLNGGAGGGLLLPFCAMHRDVLVRDKKQILLEIQTLWYLGSQSICKVNGEDLGFPISV